MAITRECHRTRCVRALKPPKPVRAARASPRDAVPLSGGPARGHHQVSGLVAVTVASIPAEGHEPERCRTNVVLSFKTKPI